MRRTAWDASNEHAFIACVHADSQYGGETLIFSTSSPPLQEPGNITCKWRIDQIRAYPGDQISLSGDQIRAYPGDQISLSGDQIRAYLVTK